MKLRTLFDKMPPKSHSSDLNSSEVLHHIMEVFQANNIPNTQQDAMLAFNSMRNIRSGVLLYDLNLRKWRGCLYVPEEPTLGIGEVSVRIDRIERRLKRLEKNYREMFDFICNNCMLRETTK